MIAKNLWRRKTRSLLTILGIAIGVAAVVAMGAIAQGLIQNYGGIIKTSNDLLVSQANAYDTMYSTLDEDVGLRLQSIPGVQNVDPGFFTFVTAEELPLFLVFGYDPDTVAIQHYRVVEGKPLTGPKQIVIGRRAAETLKKGIDDTIRIYGVPYRVVGIFETGQGLEESGGVVTLADAQTIAQKPRKVSLFQIGLARGANAEQVMQRIETMEKELVVSKASEYQGSQQWTGYMNGFAWSIAGIAILIGGLGMMNAMVMSVMERTHEIGTLRAVGWSRRRIVGMVLGEALLLSLVGGLAGIGLGVAMTNLIGLVPGLGSLLLGVFTPGIFAQGMATAICLGMLGGAYPAWAAANLTPVEALRYEGGSSGEVKGRLARTGSQSFRNLWRRKTRTIITATGIGIGVATVVMLGSLTKGFMGELNNLAGSGGTGNITVAQRDTADLSLSTLDERMIGQIRGMPGVKAVSPFIIGFVSGSDFPLFILYGIDPNSPAMDHYQLAGGQRVVRPNEIMLGKAAAKNYKVGVGDTITLINSRYKVVGLFETGVAWEDGGGLLALREAQRLLDRPRAVSFIFVDVEQASQADTVAAAINQRFSGARASLSSDFAQNTRDMQQTEGMAQGIGLLAILVGGVVVANTMIMSIYERTREIGTLRAVGWRKRRILSQVLQETFFLCLLAGVLGTLLGIVFIWGLAAIPGADSFIKPSLDPASIVQGIFLAVAIGLIGSTYPAWRASRMQPVEALRYE